jgi:SEC-C motif
MSTSATMAPAPCCCHRPAARWLQRSACWHPCPISYKNKNHDSAIRCVPMPGDIGVGAGGAGAGGVAPVGRMQQLLGSTELSLPEEEAGDYDEKFTVDSVTRDVRRGFGSSRRKQDSIATTPGNALCPCMSGRAFQDCCRSFLLRSAYPRSALELVQARLAAARLGERERIGTTGVPVAPIMTTGVCTYVCAWRHTHTHTHT